MIHNRTAKTINTWYGDISTTLFEQFAQVELLILDVDGVFSDGRIYLGNQGEELKAFHTRDGFGLKAWTDAGYPAAVITGRESSIVERRMKHLGVTHIFQGVKNKVERYEQLLDNLNLNDSQVAYVGDDVPDLQLINRAKLGIAVHDAHPSVQLAAQYITRCHGGFGAVREICDLLLLSRGELPSAEGVSL
ncbi:MAG TPA: 3-deoxy-manno-octulosonate-8-phosphatase KdsC [Idiomarina baltica]|jgi:3-deoxy-D-manno-octulosonate 8-phosphate phosphatase (KDO 8-P phosphatase)|uniref:3-deoxy-D-manno-octulosonate 8-phosphate phosphatase KdsC n=1 Tax=Idiomarina baltica TaxID=190892 RepID=A0A348WNI6_9GAMM|nr:3-deoxy-manno-octulosonate-8-phosphatase KdsC [Idiomarina baltica]MBL74193.1 3-deoxy-manno-octulosonate-8-phosphatase KdsC [Idiomarinaceae bacterium]HAE89933.1 3-deoxy-manno-octulosonate-8-phosphatase KdsC [Idiomarina sp.]HAR56098.1 3-deoxy-manno-octulosonate-8-phosphatase KdsC [Idiomarina baltica]|tara:strand:- start:2361 stop:2933 length:573 start_codon:yes stop_codon:yes gene_type:complete